MARTQLPSGGRAGGTQGTRGRAAAVRGPPALARAGPGDLIWAGEPDRTLAKCAETCLSLRVKKIVCWLGVLLAQ